MSGVFVRAGSRWLIAVSAAALVSAAWPAVAQEASELVVRLNRLEGQMRQLSGQVEQLGFENRQLKEQLRKFQEDVEFRFQERAGRTASPPSTTKPERPSRRGDAFDPNASPGAPGAPKPLGGGGGGTAPSGRDEIATIIDRSGNPAPSGDPTRGGTAAPSGGPGGGARAEYDAAYALFTGKQYDRSEAGFRAFVTAHPKDRLAGEATYWLGESLLRQNKHGEAAKSFLKVSTEYGSSPRAPDAMLKLGVSLSALGARDQACATFAELERKYPGASPTVKQGVDREQKKARCTA